MGAGVSKNVSNPPQVHDVDNLPAPYAKGEGNRCYYVVPQDEELMKKNSILVLEVGRLGFRLLRPDTEDPICLFPWGQVHSWAHGAGRFTFRFFDDNKRAILSHVLALRDLEPLLAHIQEVIEVILTERRSQAISTEQYQALVAKVSATDPDMRLSVADAATKGLFLLAEQGLVLMELLPSTFDKVEAAVLLHGRLVDQNRFSTMLEVLEAPADRDNVWHRITALKKAASALGASRSRGPTRSSPGDVLGSGTAHPTLAAGSNAQGVLGSGGPSSPVRSPTKSVHDS